MLTQSLRIVLHPNSLPSLRPMPARPRKSVSLTQQQLLAVNTRAPPRLALPTQTVLTPVLLVELPAISATLPLAVVPAIVPPVVQELVLLLLAIPRKSANLIHFVVPHVLLPALTKLRVLLATPPRTPSAKQDLTRALSVRPLAPTLLLALPALARTPFAKPDLTRALSV